MMDSGGARNMAKAKLVVLGHDSCGKTALCVRFITMRFIGEYDHEKEVTYRCRKLVDKEVIDLEILDTVNKLESQVANPMESSIRWGDGFLIIYSVTDRSSFESVLRLKRLIDHVKRTLGIPTVIVANKCDMENGRVVRREEGQALAGDLRCSFFELSVAESATAVETAVCQLIREVRVEFSKHILAMEKCSRMLQMRHALKKKLRRSKTMQW
ncbi:hypothetical protein ACEWY4_015664 [Coilia grayii]|uniref:small monomeric GTPase n=1 Tax=Coilia grayii TaxID=363190 RepID=A0ABD1JPK3_9TELE